MYVMELCILTLDNEIEIERKSNKGKDSRKYSHSYSQKGQDQLLCNRLVDQITAEICPAGLKLCGLSKKSVK